MTDSGKIMVVTHKDCDMPFNKSLYIPTLVGDNKDNLSYKIFFKDNTGDNISEKNGNFCELTAHYWAWKNLNNDFLGLVHYRRLFMSVTGESPVDSNEIERLLSKVDIILPKKRNYFIETTWSHYDHNHNIEDLKETKRIIKEIYPEYVVAFEKVMSQKKSHRFNMFIMKKQKFQEYSNWLFSILFELENRISIDSYDDYQKRVFGFISERLLDVWLERHNYDYEELPVKFIGKQNWLIKGGNFLKKKFVVKGLN